MNCLIVDDEPQARKLLATYVSAIPGCQVTGICRNAMEAYEALQTQKTDLLFLDIRMPVISGTDFLRSLKNPPLVILTTAFDKYAMEGYELNVIDYLLKPIALPRLLLAVEKARDRLRAKQAVPREQVPPTDHTFVKHDNKLIRINFNDIRYVEGMQNYIRLHLSGPPIVLLSTMKAFEQALPASRFVRIHRSYIVAVAAITAIRNNQVEIKDTVLPIGISYRDDLLKHLGQ